MFNKHVPLFLFLTTLFCLQKAQNLRKTASFQDPISALNELDNNHFGNSLMSAIAVHLSTNSPMEDIVTLLNQLKSNLQDDQEDADLRNSTEQQQCDKMLTDFMNNIEYHSEQIEVEDGFRVSNENLLKRTQNTYNQIIDDLNENTDRYDDYERTRNKQHEAYLQKSHDYGEALDALDEANSLLEHLKAGSTLIQMKKKLEKVKEKLTQHHLLHSSLYNPLINSLTEIAMSADQDSVKKILVLLVELRDSLSESKRGIEDFEATQVEDWDKIKGDLQNEKKNLISKKDDAEDELENYKRLIQFSEEKVQSHTHEYEANKALYENAKAFCENKANLYLSTSEERKNEIKILDRLFVNFNEKLGNLRDYLKNRINVDF